MSHPAPPLRHCGVEKGAGCGRVTYEGRRRHNPCGRLAFVSVASTLHGIPASVHTYAPFVLEVHTGMFFCSIGRRRPVRGPCRLQVPSPAETGPGPSLRLITAIYLSRSRRSPFPRASPRLPGPRFLVPRFSLAPSLLPPPPSRTRSAQANTHHALFSWPPPMLFLGRHPRSLHTTTQLSPSARRLPSRATWALDPGPHSLPFHCLHLHSCGLGDSFQRDDDWYGRCRHLPLRRCMELAPAPPTIRLAGRPIPRPLCT